jgi:hypothetical protein
VWVFGHADAGIPDAAVQVCRRGSAVIAGIPDAAVQVLGRGDCGYSGVDDAGISARTKS